MPTDVQAMERILRTTATPPCCSLYMPTHRNLPERDQDRVRFRNLVAELTRMATSRHGEDVAASVLAPLHELGATHDFWKGTQDGLAIFAAPGLFEVFILQRSVPERAFCADSFHTKPLRRIIQSADRFALLGITRTHIRLFAGNRDRLDPIPVPAGIPRTIEEALGEDLTKPTLTSAGSGAGGPRGTATFHGHGGRADEVDLDTERFFRVVAKGVAEKFSHHTALPLILVGLAEHHATFRAVSHNPHLHADGIAVNPDAVDMDTLRQRAWEIIGPHYVQRLSGLVERYGDHKAHGKGDDDVSAVAVAAVHGRVRTLLVDADVVIPGVLDRGTGLVTAVERTIAGVDDLLDDIAEIVTARGGEVVIVPSQEMPSATGLAAIYGY